MLMLIIVIIIIGIIILSGGRILPTPKSRLTRNDAYEPHEKEAGQ